MVAVSARYAGFWIRVPAYLIDAILLGVIGGILSAISLHPHSVDYTSSGPSALLSLVYFGLLWSKSGGGQTLGMRLFGLRVVGADGQPIGIGTALIRWLGLFLSFIVLFIGVIWVAFDPRKQGWHDKIAQTYVVYV
jgi:uncharacterized RDD family membrane protein YckC